MGKLIWIGAILILLILGIGSYFLFFNNKINVTDIDPSKLYEHSIQQNEVKSTLGSLEVNNYDVSPVYSFSKESPYFESPNLYDLITALNPSCLENLKIGDGIRVVTYHSPNRDTKIVYSTEKNKLVCVIGFDPGKYTL